MRIQTVVVFMVLIMTLNNLAQDQPETTPASVVLNIDGTIEFVRSGWISPQPLQVGTMLTEDDLIFPDDASVIVLCPDGLSQRFSSVELMPNDTLICDMPSSEYIVGTLGMKRLSVQRGGRQDNGIPYLIHPRATVVRDSHVNLVWNNPQNAEKYGITVREDTEVVWQRDAMLASEVVQGTIGSIFLPLELKADVPYTVDICVTFTNTQQGCTSDPGWSSGVDVAFYYHPSPHLDEKLVVLNKEFGDSDPKSRYASAILLAQPIDELSTIEPIAYYGEAIQYLETIINKHPNSSLAHSPELYNQLGEMYRSIYLPQTASFAFEQAIAIALTNTESYAQGAYGRALTTPSDQPAVLYDSAIETYHSYLTEDAFVDVFGTLCRTIGEICLDLTYCQDNLDFCTAKLLE
jgi:hypothetical protein